MSKDIMQVTIDIDLEDHLKPYLDRIPDPSALARNVILKTVNDMYLEEHRIPNKETVAALNENLDNAKSYGSVEEMMQALENE